MQVSLRCVRRLSVLACLLFSNLVFGDGLLRIGLQLHNEPQTNRPCTPNGQQDYLSTCVVMDSLMEIFARHGAKITFEMGLGNALSTPLWGGPSVRGSAPYMVLHPDVISIGSHIHFPADGPGFRDKFCPPYSEDNVAEANLTYAQYALAADRRRDTTVAVTGQQLRGVCGLWSTKPPLRWIPALSTTGYLWVTGWNNFQPPGGPTGGHAWCTAVNPWRAGHDLTCSYTGGVMDNFYNGAMVVLPDGAASGRMNPNEGVSFALVDSLLHENWLAGDPERINVCYLTVHDYEFKSGPNFDYAELHAWDSLLTRLDELVTSGQAVYQTMDEMYQDFVTWESLGNISYPPNGTFETRDSVMYWTSPAGVTEIVEFKRFWAPISGAQNPADGQDSTFRRHGRRAYRFVTDPNLRGIAPSTNGKHIYCVVPPDTVVEFRVWAHMDGDAQPLLGIRWYANPDTTPNTLHLSEVTGATVDSIVGEWTLLSLRADVPSNATALRTCLYKSGSGNLWYDDANLRYASRIPDAPTVTICFAGADDVRLRWTAVPQASEYRVYYDVQSDGAFADFWTVAAPDTVLNVPVIPLTQFFRVTAVSSGAIAP